MPQVTAPAARRRALVVPREHGAWGILLVPLATGASVGLWRGGSAAGLAPLTIATVALFWLRTPVESWAGAAAIRARTEEEFRLVRATALALAACAALALGWLLAGGDRTALLAIGGASAVAFAAQAVLKRTWRRARTAAQIVGALGLTSTAPAAYYVATGRLDETAWALWAANFLFAANQIHYVQVRIHAASVKSRADKMATGRAFLMAQAALMAALAVGLLPWQAALAFAPALFRGFAWFAAAPAPLAVHALGKSELAQAIVFGALLVAGMRPAG